MSSSGKFIRAVLLTGLAAGILDLTIGVLGYYLMVNGHLPENISIYIRNVLRYISSAAFGKGEGNANAMELAGFFFFFFHRHIIHLVLFPDLPFYPPFS